MPSFSVCTLALKSALFNVDVALVLTCISVLSFVEFKAISVSGKCMLSDSVMSLTVTVVLKLFLSPLLCRLIFVKALSSY